MEQLQKQQLQQEMQYLAAITGLARKGITGISEKLNPQEATLYWMAIGWSESRVGAMRDALAQAQAQEDAAKEAESEAEPEPEEEPEAESEQPDETQESNTNES